LLYKVSILLPFGGDFTASASTSTSTSRAFKALQSLILGGMVMGAEMEMGKGSGFEKVEVVQRLDNNKLLKVSEIQRMRVGKCWPDLGPD